MRRIKAQKFTGTTSSLPGAYEQPHRELVRRAAAEGFVLLKNEGEVLPLHGTGPKGMGISGNFYDRLDHHRAG